MTDVTLNSKAWWNEMFGSAWESNSGREQTRHFMERLIANLPEPELEFLRTVGVSILDWGCALGDGVDVLAHAFPDSKLVGLDFSRIAVEKARLTFPHLEFRTTEEGDIAETVDVITCSNCLEHFDAPLEVMRSQLAKCRQVYAALVPLDEKVLCESHRSRFDENSFPTEVEGFRRLHCQSIEVDDRLWGGKQLLAVYGSPDYCKSRAVRAERIAERAKWDAYYSQYSVMDDAAIRASNGALAEQFAQLLPDGGRILEVGCGAGGQSLALARLRRFDISLMDFSKPALQCAEAAFRRENESARFIQDDAFALRSPEYDLVFNAGSLEHYAAEEQIAFLRGMASRSRRYVLVLVPNNRCYWYWIWRVRGASRGHWPYGEETPVSDLSGAFRAAGLTFLGDAFLGETWTEDFITALPGMDGQLRQDILAIHRSPVVLSEQKAYLYAALGVVEPALTLPAGTVFHCGVRESALGEPRWQATQADLLAARQNAERLQADLLLARQNTVRLQAEAERREKSLSWRLIRAANVLVDRCHLRWMFDFASYPFQSRESRVALKTRFVESVRRTGRRAGLRSWILSSADRKALAGFEDMLERRDERCRKLFVQVSTVDWRITLHQRPQHMAFAMRDCGYLVVYLQPSQTDGFEKIDSNIFVVGGMLAEVWLSSARNTLISIYSTSPTAIHHTRRLLALSRTNQVVYEYIDSIDPHISGAHTSSLLAFRKFVLSARESFLFAATAQQLYDELARHVAPERVALIPNGVDEKHYRQALDCQDAAARISADMASIIARGRPIIGYFGAVAPWLDYALITEVATACPDCEFVFLGPDYRNASKSLPRQLPNFHWLGPVTYNTLPYYAKFFSVAVIPFARGDIAKTTSPLKLFEYFALGIPVVVTADLVECTRYPEVFVGESSSGFVQKIRNALAKTGDAEFKVRIQSLALENTWRRRAETMVELSTRNELLDNLAKEFSLPVGFVRMYLSKQDVSLDAARNWSELQSILPALQKLYFQFALTTVFRGRDVFKTLKPFLIRRHGTRRYLDVGCGYGGFVRVFAERGWSATGVELVPQLAAYSRATCKDLVNAKILEGDFLSMATSALGIFDCITCNDVIEHVSDAERAMIKLLDLLEKKGVLFLEIPNKDCVDFVTKDGHFQLFGINLLPREQAAEYHHAMTGESGYLTHMGEFYELSYYTSIIEKGGFEYSLLKRHVTGDPSELPRKRDELVAAHEEWKRGWAENLPRGIFENLEQKYQAYLRQLERDINEPMESVALTRKYLLSFWSVVVRGEGA